MLRIVPSSVPKASALQRILRLGFRDQSAYREKSSTEQARGLKTGYFILAPCLKLQDIDGFVAFINSVINQVVLLYQFQGHRVAFLL